jgi:hypothetical protein
MKVLDDMIELCQRHNQYVQDIGLNATVPRHRKPRQMMPGLSHISAGRYQEILIAKE